MIAPEPLALPSLVATSMDTTESDTSFATALQSAASPDLAFAEPDPDVLDFTLVSELEVGTVTHPLVIAA